MFPLSYEIAAEVRDLKPLGGLFRLEGDEFERAYHALWTASVATGSSGVRSDRGDAPGAAGAALL